MPRRSASLLDARCSVMIVLSASVLWFGVVQHRRDFLSLVLRSHLRTAAALAAVGALFPVFGIG